jgi:hypothetical protein
MTSEPNGVIDSWTLPWPEIRVPPYRTGHVGEWELKRQRQSVLRGYFRGLQTCTENYLLMRDNRVWMSLSPVEIESLAPHVAQMRGHVVIAGLGIGLALSNALLRPPVRRVTVLECDNEVIALFASISDCGWSRSDRFTIEQVDAREWRSAAPVASGTPLLAEVLAGVMMQVPGAFAASMGPYFLPPSGGHARGREGL